MKKLLLLLLCCAAAIITANGKDNIKKKNMTEKKFATFDLHLHTVWSYDASAEVEEHIRRAADLGLRCVAITEHNNMDSWPEIAKLRSKYPQIKFIPGVEFSVNTEFGSIDIVCLNMPEKPTPELEKFSCGTGNGTMPRSKAI